MSEHRIVNFTNSIFEQEWWLRAVAPSVPWKEVLVKNKEDVQGRWIVPSRGPFTMPHLTQTIGFWINPELKAGDPFRNKQKLVIRELIEKLPRRTHISLAPENEYFLPFLWEGFTIRPCITYRINDLSDMERLYASFPTIVKKNIKSARNKVRIVESEDISILYHLMEKTFQLQNRKYPFALDYLKRIYSACQEHDAARLLYAQDNNGNYHSGVMFVYDENVCYYLIAGTDPQFRSSGANSLLIWDGIQFASSHSRCFDFEGSMIDGVENFFRQFGGTLTVYYDLSRQNLFQDLLCILKPRIKRILHYK